MSDETQDSIPAPSRVASGGLQGMVGSSAGGAGVLGLFLALQSAGILPTQAKDTQKTTEEIRREIGQEQARASLLEHLQQAARSNAERLTQLATIMGSLEESISDLETQSKQAEKHLGDTLNSEFGFLVQACFDEYELKRRAKRKRKRKRKSDSDEDDSEEDEDDD